MTESMEVEGVDVEGSGAATDRTIEVEKALGVDVDLGTLLLSDPNEINTRSLK
jgi:hypothetical protein